MGVRWGLQTAIRLGLSNFSIASDALSVVTCLQKQNMVAVIMPIVQDCRDILLNLPFCFVFHTRRQLNTQAHDLVSLAKIHGCNVWEGYPPSSVFSNLNADVLSGFRPISI